MSLEVWVTISIIAVVYFGWLIREIYNAPLMPDDYDEEENIKEEIEK
mgnify:CR=1 FL=1|tara:strand:- start:394 stop:534 length:141 start_codon:yes stop_codon:yes gene_type:complete